MNPSYRQCRTKTVQLARYAFLMPSLLLALILLTSCGKEPTKRCRTQEEAQMKCKIELAERYQTWGVPDWIKSQCQVHYPVESCYLDDRH